MRGGCEYIGGGGGGGRGPKSGIGGDAWSVAGAGGGWNTCGPTTIARGVIGGAIGAGGGGGTGVITGGASPATSR